MKHHDEQAARMRVAMHFAGVMGALIFWGGAPGMGLFIMGCAAFGLWAQDNDEFWR